MAKVVDAQGQTSNYQEDLPQGKKAPRPRQKETSQAQFKEGIPEWIANLAVVTAKTINHLRKDRNQI